MNEAAPDQPDLTPAEEARLDHLAETSSYDLGRSYLRLTPPKASSPAQVARSNRLKARAQSHAETVDRGQMDPAVELARVLRGARERQLQEPQTLDDDMFNQEGH